VPYLSTSAVMIHNKEAIYQVYAPLPLPLFIWRSLQVRPHFPKVFLLPKRAYGIAGVRIFFPDRHSSYHKPTESKLSTYIKNLCKSCPRIVQALIVERKFKRSLLSMEKPFKITDELQTYTL